MIYTKKFVPYYDIFRDNYSETVDFLHSFFQKHNVQTVLDVGCGTSKVTQLLKDKGYSIVVIDNSPEMLEYAQLHHADIDFQLMDVRTCDLNRKFDACIALQSVITFLITKNDFEKGIRNMIKHLADKSILYFTVAFTDTLMPPGFTDTFLQKVVKNNVVYTKEVYMKRNGEILTSDITIKENGTIMIQEMHDHRIISERDLKNYLESLGCTVTSSGNSREGEFQPLAILAKKG